MGALKIKIKRNNVCAKWSKDQTMLGAKLDFLTSTTSIYLSRTLCLNVSISANSTTMSPRCSVIRF